MARVYQRMLGRPEATDPRSELMTKYPTIRCFAPAFLEVFEFRGGAAVSSLLKALGLISEMYHLGKRTLPHKAAYRIYTPSLAVVRV